MKMFKYKFLFLMLVFSFVACDSALDLDPSQSISEGQAVENDANIKAVLVGAYDEFGVGNLYGGETLRNADLLGSNGELLWQGTFNAPREIFNHAMIAQNGDAEGVWVDAYQTINIANNVLAGLSVVNAVDQGTVEGEALFLRSMLFFDLVRFYAKPFVAGGSNDQLGIPLVTEPTRSIDEKSFVTRNTVAQVYTQVVADLTRAENLLPEDNSWRASKDAAAAALARVYLQMGDFANARDAANRVIGSGRYLLVPSYANVFNRDDNSTEDIFAIQNSSQDGTNAMNTFFSIPEFGGRDGDIQIQQAHLDLYDAADERLALFFESAGSTFSGKWNNQNGNIALFRLAEMYLIRAETNQRLGTSVGDTPVNDYNQVHERAGLAAATSVTLDDILLERRLELAQEGFSVHDIRRLQGTLGPDAYDADNTIFPIPDSEINANPNMVQNPGY